MSSSTHFILSDEDRYSKIPDSVTELTIGFEFKIKKFPSSLKVLNLQAGISLFHVLDNNTLQKLEDNTLYFKIYQNDILLNGIFVRYKKNR